MSTPEGVAAKVKRANEHFYDLEAALSRYVDSEPYEIVSQDDPFDPERVVLTLNIREPLPDAISLILGDMIHNLRSALDHVAFALSAPTPEQVPNIAFPVWRRPRVPTPNELETLIRGKVGGAREQVIDALCRLEPYQGGDGEPIWLLDQLDIIDKHRLLLTTPMAYEWMSFDITPASHPELGDGPELRLRLRQADRTVEDGSPLFSAPRDSFVSGKEHQFYFEITLGEPEVLNGQPILPTLSQLGEYIDGLIATLATRFL